MTVAEERGGAGGIVGRCRASFAGMSAFNVIWAGQLVTLLGTGMMKFALVVHTWTDGGRATTVVGLFLAAFLPKMLLSPIAGTLVDRWPKKAVLQLSDLGGMLAIGALTAVYFAGHLQIWQIYLALAVAGVAESFQYPAFSAAVPILVPRDKLQRASGMMATAQSITEIGGPSLAGVLLGTAGLGAVLGADTATFAVAVATILAVAVKDPRRQEQEEVGKLSLWGGSAEGLRYIATTPSLRSLTLVFLVANISAVFGFAVLPMMILARSGNDSATWAIVSVCTGVGGIAGGLVMTAFKTPRNRAVVMLLAMAGTGLVGQMVMATGRDLPAWCAAELVCATLLPIVNGMLMMQLQTKVPPSLQGRVFGSSMFASQCLVPLVFIAVGPLADHVFAPQAAAGSGIVGLLSPLLGHGAGTGMAAMLFLAGAGTLVVGLAGLAAPSLRRIDQLMPDLEPEDDDPADSGESPDAGSATPTSVADGAAITTA